MRPQSQLVLSDTALRKPSTLASSWPSLKKNESVSGYHYVPARAPRLVDLPDDLHPAIRDVLALEAFTNFIRNQAGGVSTHAKARERGDRHADRFWKNVCYNLPVRSIGQEAGCPSSVPLSDKALTYDQMEDLMGWTDALGADIGCLPTMGHAAGCPRCGPVPGAHRSQQSGHVAQRHPAASHAMDAPV